jgi:cell division protein FtsQ
MLRRRRPAGAEPATADSGPPVWVAADESIPAAVPVPAAAAVAGSPVPGSPVPGSPVPGSPVPGSPETGTSWTAGPAADSTAQDATAAPAGPKEAGPEAAGRKTGTQPRQKRRDPWRVAFFAVLALAIAGGAAWALLGSSLLVVRHEQVTGNKLVPAATVIAAVGIRPGTPLASVNTTAAARRVEQIAQVLTARVTRSFPDTVVITVRERTPALAVQSGGGFALIDASGVTVRWSARKPAGLPVLTLAPAQLRGDRGVRAAVTVLARLPHGLRRLVKSVSAPSAAAVTLTLRDGVTVLWGSPDSAARKAAELAVLVRTQARRINVSDPVTAVTQR